MKIFLAHASEDEKAAQAIALSLRSRAYKVFLDADTLPPGESFDRRIGRAVKESDLFIFLISPDSVAAGRYSMTELSFASAKWPNPHGRVLPVVLRATPADQIPPYLRAVTISTPVGNIAAETGALVDKSRHALSSASFRRKVAVFLAVLLIVGFGALLAWNASLQSQNNTLKSNKASLEEALQKRNVDISQLKSDYDKLTSSKASLEEALQKRNVEVSQMKSENDRLTSLNLELQGTLRGQSLRIASLDARSKPYEYRPFYGVRYKYAIADDGSPRDAIETERQNVWLIPAEDVGSVRHIFFKNDDDDWRDQKNVPYPKDAPFIAGHKDPKIVGFSLLLGPRPILELYLEESSK